VNITFDVSLYVQLYDDGEILTVGAGDEVWFKVKSKFKSTKVTLAVVVYVAPELLY
jgi:hypothetical protein